MSAKKRRSGSVRKGHQELRAVTAVEKIYQDALALPSETRVELTERLADDVSAEIQRAHIDEVRKRIAQIKSGEVELIAGDEALARVRSVLTKHLATANNELESS